jgi:hypothetical protein
LRRLGQSSLVRGNAAATFPAAAKVWSITMTPTAFRKLALSFPGAHESAHVSHPDFRVGEKVFATLAYPDARFGMVKLTPYQQRRFVSEFPKVFLAVSGGWGLRGATNVRLRNATLKALRPALHAAWQNNAPKSLLSQTHPGPKA